MARLGGEIAAALNQIEQAAHVLRATWLVRGELDLEYIGQIEGWCQDVRREYQRLRHPNT